MGFSFNLIDKPWLPVIENGGERRQVGIAEALCRAHEIAELRDASPLVTVALHRLLLVIVHRAHDGPMSLKEWGRMWKAGKFREREVKGYLKEMRSRFDLFDAKKPFFQDARKARSTPDDVARLFSHRATKTNISHFSHDYKGVHRACPACCAKWLAVLPAFCTSGGAGLQPSINGEPPPVYVLLRGHSLFQALMFSLPIPGVSARQTRDDLPAWERTTRGRNAVGFMQGLTWQPRTILLSPPEETEQRCTVCGATSGALIRRTVFGKGQVRSEQTIRGWSDPHVPLVRSGKRLGPLKPPDPFKARWKCPRFWCWVSGAILVDVDREVRAPVLGQLSALAEKGGLPGSLQLTVDCTGLHSVPGQFKLFTVSNWRWSFPASRLTDESHRGGWKRLLDLADDLSEKLNGAGAVRITKRSTRVDTARRALAAFERRAERIFREHVERPEAASVEVAEARMKDAAERAFELALPAQGAYSERGSKRARAVIVDRFGWAVREAVRKRGEE